MKKRRDSTGFRNTNWTTYIIYIVIYYTICYCVSVNQDQNLTIFSGRSKQWANCRCPVFFGQQDQPMRWSVRLVQLQSDLKLSKSKVWVDMTFSALLGYQELSRTLHPSTKDSLRPSQKQTLPWKWKRSTQTAFCRNNIDKPEKVRGWLSYTNGKGLFSMSQWRRHQIISNLSTTLVKSKALLLILEMVNCRTGFAVSRADLFIVSGRHMSPRPL